MSPRISRSIDASRSSFSCPSTRANRRDSADGGGHRRLLREARAAAQLDHPFICKVYEVGEHDGRAFFAMEFVEGVTLKARLASGRLTTDEALRIGGEIAEALNFAHSRGIVHRDIKPANVMLAADGHVKVMDFGVAKRMVAPPGAEDVTAGAATATLPGEPTGTLAYMSPEQIRGEPIDARSDVFAFGVLLHELLTGTHPFKRSSAIETAHAILNETRTAARAKPARGPDAPRTHRQPLSREGSDSPVSVARRCPARDGGCAEAAGLRRSPQPGPAEALDWLPWLRSRWCLPPLSPCFGFGPGRCCRGNPRWHSRSGTGSSSQTSTT